MVLVATSNWLFTKLYELLAPIVRPACEYSSTSKRHYYSTSETKHNLILLRPPREHSRFKIQIWFLYPYRILE